MEDMGFSCRIPCVKPLLNNRQRQKSLEEERRGTESTLLEVQCKVSTVSDGLGCHVICWCWSTVFSEVQ
ncbi:hypothetical protein M9458_038267, partial [Cirrhinus mrigala]